MRCVRSSVTSARLSELRPPAAQFQIIPLKQNHRRNRPVIRRVEWANRSATKVQARDRAASRAQPYAPFRPIVNFERNDSEHAYQGNICLRANTTLAGRSAMRRMYHGNQ